MKRKNSPITPEEAARAIFLDFEGPGRSRDGTEHFPMFAGILCDGDYEFFALDDRFGDFSRAKGHTFVFLDQFLQATLNQAFRESRRIVFWTSHEADLFEAKGYPPSAIGFDVRPPAKRSMSEAFKSFRQARQKWKNPKTAKTTKAQLKTKAFGLLTLITQDLGFKRPAGYGAGCIGEWITNMSKQASTKSDYRGWAPGAKKRAGWLRKHNRHDCEATEFLLKHLLRGRQSLS